VSGDLERGFLAYEWRWRLPEVKQRSLPGLLWSGEPLKGKLLSSTPSKALVTLFSLPATSL